MSIVTPESVSPTCLLRQGLPKHGHTNEPPACCCDTGVISAELREQLLSLHIASGKLCKCLEQGVGASSGSAFF